MLTPSQRVPEGLSREYVPPHLQGELEWYFIAHLLELILMVISGGKL
jgi:hypothetical protein